MSGPIDADKYGRDALHERGKDQAFLRILRPWHNVPVIMRMRIDKARGDNLPRDIQRCEGRVSRRFGISDKDDPVLADRDIGDHRIAQAAIIYGAIQEQDIRFLDRHLDRLFDRCSAPDTQSHRDRIGRPPGAARSQA